MMKSKDEQKKASVSAVVEADRLRQIYDILDDEPTPFRAKVKKVGKGVREITIYADGDNIGHFNNLLYGNTEI